ncbi:glycerate kinase [Sabethes cyaneus]|uniref:glycerate kinase n=1 Tax=Sabethes cyaneus TaxID=53552 RepID=UPI00237DFA3A|nr:glycerate kinase [Sabethes cyaneus]
MQTLLRSSLNLNATGYRLQHVTVPAAMESTLKALFLNAVDAVKPKALFDGYIGDNKLLSEQLQVPDKHYHLVGFGKAVLGMAVQMERLLGNRLRSGYISIPVGTLDRFKSDTDFQLSISTKIRVFECARNNLPDQEAVEVARTIKSFAESMTEKDILCVLVSGGGSALLPLPKEPATLQEKLFVIKQLVEAGASIDELNSVRIHLSDIKGGKLALAAWNAFDLISFVISDIVGDPIELVASGPTVKSSITRRAAWNVIDKYGLSQKVPSNVKLVLDNPSSDLFEIKENIHLVGSNQKAVNSIVQNCQNTQLFAIVMSTSIEGNVNTLCREYINLTTAIVHFQRKIINDNEFRQQIMQFCSTFRIDEQKATRIIDDITNNTARDILLVFGGEPTVIIRGGGVGGRNQELALRFSNECYRHGELLEHVRFLSAGTDGIDGPTDAAGATGGACVIKSYEEQRMAKSVEEFIEGNDSYSFYRNVRNGLYHIVTGHTGTNVMDIHLLYVPRCMQADEIS